MALCRNGSFSVPTVKLPPKTCAEVLAAIATEAMGKLNGRLKHVFPDWAGCKMALKTPLDYKGAKAGVATSGGVAFKVEIASVRTHLGWRAMACVLRATPPPSRRLMHFVPTASCRTQVWRTRFAPRRL